MDLAPGMMVTPNVRLVELLGTGGMGSVWLAEHLGLEARVAVKFLSLDLAALEPTVVQRFKSEASIHARLRSIHVVQTFDHGDMENGAPYIVMELLEGATLTQFVEQHGPMPPRLVAMMVAQVVKVLHRAHVLGIVHRDIKPDNIFITDDSDYELFIKVLDFGIAKQKRVGAEPLTATGVVVGTPEFMSPEQAISSKNIDYRSDLFSLAVVTFYALTGELPFDSKSDDPLWLQMSSGKHRAATSFRPELPPEIDKWFAHALEPKPEDRFRSARTMADAFAAIVRPEEAHQIVDELSESDGPAWPPEPKEEEDSHPAMYDLMGPDSEEYGDESTLLMNEQDHLAAEDDEPPTRRRPDRYPAARRAPASAGAASVRAAVAAGVYNGGVAGAFNQSVSPTLVDAELASQPPEISPEPPTLRAEPHWPTSVAAPRSRLPAVLAVFGAVVVITTMAVIAYWHLV
jgi:serine/threonine-protein kinase